MRSKLQIFFLLYLINISAFATSLESVTVSQLTATSPFTHVWQAQLNKATLIWETTKTMDGKSLLARLRYKNIVDEPQLSTLLKPLLQTIAKTSILKQHTSIGLDRLEVYPPMSRALTFIMAQKNKNDWDYMRGKPVEKISINTYVERQLQNIGPQQSVLIKMLQEHGLKSSWSGVEKVLVKRVREFPWSKELISMGLGPLSMLPFDCIVWLKLENIN
jgi:hypothetical protein